MMPENVLPEELAGLAGRGRYIMLDSNLDNEFFYLGGVLLIRKGTPIPRTLEIIEKVFSGKTEELV